MGANCGGLLGMTSSVQKTRSKRAIQIEDGVVGTELSLYVKDINKSDIKIAYLHKGNKVYKNLIKIYFDEKKIEDLDILNFCNLLHLELVVNQKNNVSEIYQAIANVIVGKQIRNFEHRPLKLIPYQQVTIPPVGYAKFTETIKKEFFEKPLKERVRLNEI